MKSNSFGLLIAVAFGLLPIHGDNAGNKGGEPAANTILIPASATMVTAWDIPKNPLTDSSLTGNPLSQQIRWGFQLFTQTSQEAPQFSKNKLLCNNCHLNAGQKEKAMPLVGVAAVFPEYNKREGRLFSLEDRIIGCFTRSQNGTEGMHESLPSTNSKEVLALSAYITWLSNGIPVGKNPAWRGHNVIASNKLIPVDKLDPKTGETLFKEKCSSCHGEDGQGVEIGDKKAGPLWGPDSWNDGAGAARVYTLAGMIRYTMPYLDPGSLTDAEAQQIAAFINSQQRPEFPFKQLDYRVESLPPDAVYYKR
jgi:thiosulfate dehydrogenase